MFLRRQKSLVVPPSLYQCESSSFPGGVSKSVDNILTSGLLCHSAHDPLNPLHPHLQLHPGLDDQEEDEEVSLCLS